MRYRRIMSEHMHEIELDEETSALVHEVAAKTGLSPDDVVAQALSEWVAQDGEPTTQGSCGPAPNDRGNRVGGGEPTGSLQG